MNIRASNKNKSLDKANLTQAKSIMPKLLTSGILFLFFIAILVVFVLALILGYQVGFKKGVHHANTEATITEEGQMLTADNIKAIKLENDILKNQVATAQQERDISLTNLSELRQKQTALKVANLQLEQINKTYAKALVQHGGIPLQIIGVEIEPLPENAFEYRFDIAMLSQDGKAKTLIPKLTLLNETSLVEVPMEPSQYKIKGIARVRGRFMMPKGFKPVQAKIEVNVGNKQLEQLYNWRLGKQIANMPLSLAEVPDVNQSPVQSTN